MKAEPMEVLIVMFIVLAVGLVAPLIWSEKNREDDRVKRLQQVESRVTGNTVRSYVRTDHRHIVLSFVDGSSMDISAGRNYLIIEADAGVGKIDGTP